MARFTGTVTIHVNVELEGVSSEEDAEVFLQSDLSWAGEIVDCSLVKEDDWQ